MKLLKAERVSNGVFKVLEQDLQDKYDQAQKEVENTFEFDEVLITLQQYMEQHPKDSSIWKILERSMELRKVDLLQSANLPDAYLKWAEKEVIKARIELLRPTWSKYTLEEIASMVRS